MQTRDKWIIATLILVMSVTGMSYYGFAHNDTQTNTSTQQPTTIVVNGNGSSGTGDVQNVQQVTQVTQVSGSGETSSPSVKQTAEQGGLTNTEYTPAP